MLVTLTTDFGTADGYVGAVKGVLVRRLPQAHIIDVSHDIAPGDIAAASFALCQAVPQFPEKCVHLAVVDPGVGTQRREIVIAIPGQGPAKGKAMAKIGADTGTTYLVGPDNGVLLPVVSALVQRRRGAVDEVRIKALDPASALRAGSSHTFHGRDLFAPMAAQVARPGGFERIGPSLALGELVCLDNGNEGGPAHGGQRGITTSGSGDVELPWDVTVLHVDRFGNLVTSLTRHYWFANFGPVLPAVSLEGTQGGASIAFGQTYGDVAPGEPVAYWGSGGR